MNSALAMSANDALLILCLVAVLVLALHILLSWLAWAKWRDHPRQTLLRATSITFAGCVASLLLFPQLSVDGDGRVQSDLVSGALRLVFSTGATSWPDVAVAGLVGVVLVVACIKN